MSASKEKQRKFQMMLSKQRFSHSQKNVIKIQNNSDENQSSIQAFDVDQKINVYPLKIKNYVTKFKSSQNYSEPRLIHPRKILAAQIYQRRQFHENENAKNEHLDEINMKIIQQNLIKMQMKLPNRIPKLLKNLQRKRNSVCNSTKNSMRQQNHKFERKYVKKQNNNPFLFSYQQNQRKELISKKISSRHFDRLKYFKNINSQNLTNSAVNNYKMKSKTARKLTQNYNIYENQNLHKKQFQQQDISKSRIRTPKPSTAGGWLKKYYNQQYCFRSGSKINFDDFSLY